MGRKPLPKRAKRTLHLKRGGFFARFAPHYVGWLGCQWGPHLSGEKYSMNERELAFARKAPDGPQDRVLCSVLPSRGLRD